MRRIFYIVVVLITIEACKKQITIPSSGKATSYLVVDGNISSGDSTFITLRRTVSLDSNSRVNWELGATVTVVSTSGTTYSLTGRGNGNYVSAPLNLSASEKYSLKITTSNGSKYASDFVPLKNSPPIDSIQYQIEGNGLQISLDTHDAANSTKYYRWDYAETYQIQTPFESLYTVVATNLPSPPDYAYIRSSEQKIFNCWRSDTSSDITLGSSAQLSNDKISRQPISFIPSNSEKLRFRYSIIIKQFAISIDAYNYYTLLKKNTEQIGGIFDPQPSELTGNIHCLSNINEPVIGYLTAGTVTQKRIFIDKSALPASYVAETPYGACKLDTLLYDREIIYLDTTIIHGHVNQVEKLIYSGIELAVDKSSGGYTGAFPQCVDCTLRGTNKKPSFWK
jgi:hypothetical protein